ncbi:anthocyanidin 3-O-glucosyltransferase 5-like [Macadamia integrifolia]|uniref:anthocyanidin 3-O-glucosyltransferase 5-like n=1 Tax=Macadamia integrifolia TaxID=60698 RepID=UPI001C4E40D8|nr:anthocyanidin 3-O-glucosyltransferase 5-like [Macadamia integrifolia]
MPLPVYPVGPIVRSSGLPCDKSHADCLAWLVEQPVESVIYVSFGSGGTLSEEQLTELAFGLELSGKRFLWVVRPPAGKDGALFNAGGGGDGLSRYLRDGFLNRTQEVGLVVPMWAPQLVVLSHPSVGITLWMELDIGKHGERSTDYCVAAVRRTEDECGNGGGGIMCGFEDEGVADEDGGEKGRDREAGEVGNGKGRGSNEEKNEGSEGEWVESGG